MLSISLIISAGLVNCGGGFEKDSSGVGPIREWLTGDSLASAKAEAVNR